MRQGTEISSHRRAATSFVAQTKIPVSKSSVGRLVQLYGGQIVAQQAAEAEATVKPPALDEVITERQMVQPDSQVMAISMDGALVNIRGEGWKEVKTVSISAVETETDAETGEAAVPLGQHSYRAGMWQAKTFAKQQWAEGVRRGLERAQHLVSVNDGAPWIWLIIQMCWAPCVEILDWWHLVEKVWEVAATLFPSDTAVAQWVETQKSHLWHGRPRAVLKAIRQLCPRGQSLPDKVRLVVGYLFNHRLRLSRSGCRPMLPGLILLKSCGVGCGKMSSISIA